MDTRIWGPSAWSLLHSIAVQYPGSKYANNRYTKFFNNLKYILPCIHCRQSYVKYIEILPYNETVMQNNYTLSKNIFKIHKKVTNKLSKQGYVVEKTKRHEVYFKRLQEQNFQYESNNQIDIGYTFIGCVVFNYPTNPCIEIKQQYKTFFRTLSQVYPTKYGKKILKQYLKDKPINDSLGSRTQLVRWFAKSPIIKYTPEYELGKSKIPIRKLKEHFESFRAGCKSQSCRKRGQINRKIILK